MAGLRNQVARMSWILGCLALACFGWAATMALLVRAMEERDQARDMCVLLMSRKKKGGDAHGNRSAD